MLNYAGDVTEYHPEIAKIYRAAMLHVPSWQG
jgi:hypothetical protein